MPGTCRSNWSPLRNGRSAVDAIVSSCGRDAAEETGAKIEARADPPEDRTFVDLGKNENALVGRTLFTKGLFSCVAVVIRSGNDQAEGVIDKIVAHVSSSPCRDEGHPNFEGQMDNIFFKYDKAPIENPQVYAIAPPSSPLFPAQDLFVAYIQDRCNGKFGSHQKIVRNQDQVNEPGGSRLWIDDTKNVY
ncbi:hypothetical protein F5X98DRAFT_391795 [Xylaria grammica]|nr:hypothetical protein F5X98DRAFT_391795 [Xylaria grammica]